LKEFSGIMLKQHEKLILASASPRRKELLQSMGIKFVVQPSDIAEVGYGGAPEKVPSRIVTQKMKATKVQMGLHLEGYVLAADTIVALGKEIYGKPENMEHARSMLRQLSGKIHQVYTCFRVEGWNGEFIEKTTRTDVKMRKLSDQMLQWYLNTNEPFDKAGGYAIQGFGSVLVESIQGSYTNVLGLPMAEVMDALVELKVISFS
jgi:septum formation protein